MPAPSEEDRWLIDRYLLGDPAAVRKLDGWIEAVLHESFRSLREDWDDLRQEILARVLRNLSRGLFNGRSTLRTYVHRISQNVAIDFSRQAYRRREVRIDPGDPQMSGRTLAAGAIKGWIARDLLDRILSQLSEDDRTILRLVFELQYSYDEVSRELGIPAGTVKSRMSRCKERVLKLGRELLKQG